MDKFLPCREDFLNQNKLFLTLSCFLLLFIFNPSLASAQSCGCQDQVNVILQDDCTFTVDVDLLKAGNCGDNARIIVVDGDPSNGPLVECAGLWNYAIIDEDDNLLCDGTVLAEDKAGPSVADVDFEHELIECTYQDFIFNNPTTIDPNSDFYIGRVIFEDNCASCGCVIDVKFFDQIIPQDCTPNTPNVGPKLLRRWTATDCEGNQTVYDQEFEFFRPALDDLTSVSDTTIQTCDPGSITTIETSYPFWTDVFGNRLYLDDVTCNYSTNVRDRRFSNVCEDGSYKIERTISVLDWCTGQSQDIDTYVIKVGDFEAPVFSGNAIELESSTNILDNLTDNYDRSDFETFESDGILTTVPVGPDQSCTASFFTTLSALESRFGFDVDDCADVDISVSIYTYGPTFIGGFPVGPDQWQETNYPMINNVASGIPIGLHALVISVSDGCKNNATGVLFFKVKDLTPPVMKCDDKLTITVTTGNAFLPSLGAYARVDAIDVDEGSQDNCELDRLLVRRSVADLSACQDAFIALGYDGNNDNVIDGNDWFDENNNGVFDADTEFRWELKNGVWMTPWREFAEFFCCDVDQSVVVELGGWDAAVDPLSGMEMPNFSLCWLDIVIEDKIEPTISNLPDYEINCDDDVLSLLQDGIYNEIDDAAILAEIRARFGSAVVSNTTCGSTTLEEEITTFMDSRCKTGYIQREVRISKAGSKGTSTSSTTQRIDVVIKHDYSICFPADVTVDCEDGNLNVPGPVVDEGSCDLLALFTAPDERFDTGDPDNGCYKIFRTYRLINWCEYDGISPPVIVGRDWDGDFDTNPKKPDGDGVPGDEGICVIVKRNFLDNNPDTVYYDRDTDPYNNIPGNDASVSPNTQGYWWRVISGSNDPNDQDYYDGPFDNDFSGTITTGEETVWANDDNDNGSQDDDDYNYGSNGYWEYTQHIKVNDVTDPEILVSGQDTFPSLSQFDCAGEVSFTITLSDNCTSADDLSLSVFLDEDNNGGTLVDVSDDLSGNTFSSRYPLGEHRLIFRTRDDCGNLASAEVIFAVVDGLAPSPICKENLVVNLFSVDDDRIAINEVWATDYTDGKAIGDCTGQGPEMVDIGNGIMRPRVTKFSINRKGEAYHPDSNGLVVTCADVGTLVAVEVHAIDEVGNHGFCNTFVTVQDNSNLCPGGAVQAEIAGLIGSGSGEMIADVEVRLSGPINRMDITDQSGAYSFSQLEAGHDYTVIPSKDDDYRNGISISDLIMIKKHVLGYEQLADSYQMIAADINDSGTITVKDLIELQRLILYKIDDFADNNSWRFVDKYHVFDASNAWNSNYPELSNINNLKRDMMTTDFIGVKIGDPNQSARLTGAQAVQPRSEKNSLSIAVEDAQLKAGEERTVYLKANLADFEGFQFTLSLDQSVELLDVQSALLNEEQMAVFADQGLMTAAWADVSGNNAQVEESLFGITIRATRDVAISEALSINSRLTDAEAVKADDQIPGNVKLKFGSDEANQQAYAIYESQPNPFNEFTIIGFDLPENAEVSIGLFDVNGRLVKTFDGDYNFGYNQIRINSTDLPAAGVYFLNLKSGSYQSSTRIVNLR